MSPPLWIGTGLEASVITCAVELPQYTWTSLCVVPEYSVWGINGVCPSCWKWTVWMDFYCCDIESIGNLMIYEWQTRTNRMVRIRTVFIINPLQNVLSPEYFDFESSRPISSGIQVDVCFLRLPPGFPTVPHYLNHVYVGPSPIPNGSLIS